MHRKIAIGIGCRRGVASSDIRRLVDAVMEEASLEFSNVELLASCEIKKGEHGLLEFAEYAKVPLVFFTVDELNRIDVPNPSQRVSDRVGTSSVCEASAILASGGGRLIAEKRHSDNTTVAIAEFVQYAME